MSDVTKSLFSFFRRVGTWLGDRLPDPVGSWLLCLADDSEEPWTDPEGRAL